MEKTNPCSPLSYKLLHTPPRKTHEASDVKKTDKFAASGRSVRPDAASFPTRRSRARQSNGTDASARHGSLLQALSAITRTGFCQGRPA
jgi:hypothetical protein